MQHNSTLYISPQITRRPNIFVTPPNPPPAQQFEPLGSTQSLFYQLKPAGVPLGNSGGNAPGMTRRNSKHNDSINELSSVQLSQAERLRLWRHDALMQHHYQTAEFVGNKILQLTGDPNDAFWLAQVYVNLGNYIRAKSILTKFLDSVGCRYLAALSAVKLEQWEDALDLVGELNPFRDDIVGGGVGGVGGNVGGVGGGGNGNGNLGGLGVGVGTISGIGNSQASGLGGLNGGGNGVGGPANGTLNANLNANSPTSDGGVKLEASMCYLRGLIYANQNNFEKAKDSYKEALLIDAKCYEAFSELVSNSLMTPREEWEFISQLNYRVAEDNENLVKLLYMSQLSKYKNPESCVDAMQILDEEYGLLDNPDLLLAKADLLLVQCKFDECMKVCDKLFSIDAYFLKAVPLQLVSLFELKARNKLFLLAHQLAEQHPLNPVTWLAIATYYFLIGKIVEARKFFLKTTLLNPNFAQAWIGFAHTFAVEGEHEQAISAYAFAARVFPGTHLPNLFLGMQNLQMGNLQLLEEYLLALYQICSTDPLLLNELGVVSYMRGRLPIAEQYCREALGAAKYLNSDLKTWVLIHTNLGHILRRLGQPHRALECFEQVLKLLNRDDGNVLAAIGLVYMKLRNYLKAIDVLHDALAVSPSDPIANDLLKRALDANVECSETDFFKGTTKTMELNLEHLKKRAERMSEAPKDDNDLDLSEDEQVMDIESE